jgi:CMP-2-keto-3-deoxyoctulosonic acid synthetase
MNRFLEHGIKIKMISTLHKSFGVDVPADVDVVEPLLRNDPLIKNYLSGINRK